MNEMLTDSTDFNQPLETRDVRQVTDMSGTFRGATSFNQSLDSGGVSLFPLGYTAATDTNRSAQYTKREDLK